MVMPKGLIVPVASPPQLTNRYPADGLAASKIVSASANDISYDKIFSFQIEKLCKKNDVLFLFSVSGNSPNLVEAIKIAKKIGVKTVSFTGFNGGKLSKMSDFNINFPIANFGIAEDCHISIMHYLSQYLRNINIKNKDFNKINF